MPVLSLRAGLVSVAAVSSVVVACDAPSGGDAAAELLDALRRSHDATFTAEGTYERTTDGGAKQSDDLVVVQRPPDRIALGYGSWDGVMGGRGVHCTRDGRSGEWQSCATTPAPDGDAAPIDLATLQARQLDEVEDLTTGAEPVYAVSPDGDGCFLMLLEGATRFVPAYGERTRWCFDAATGATSMRRVEHGSATDVTRYDHISGEARATDFPPKTSIQPAEVPMGDP